MLVHIGGDFSINEDYIVGFFDMDTSTVMKTTRNFLYLAEKNNRIINVSYELPKSFILHTNGEVYISQISTSTLRIRSDLLISLQPYNLLGE